jgi:hypothetical protein
MRRPVGISAFVSGPGQVRRCLGFCAILLGAAVTLAAPAGACPAGTVFSAYKGNGICAWSGEGARAAVQCHIRKGGSCPGGTTTEHKNSDKKNYYCCPKQTKGGPQKCHWSGTEPFCQGSCGPGFTAVKSVKCFTGHRVYCCD